MASVIIFGPTGQIGSAAALTAANLRAKVWLAMRDPSKSIPGLDLDIDPETSSQFQKLQADLNNPASITQALKTSGAKRAFLYLVHSSPDHQRAAIEALKPAALNSSFSAVAKGKVELQFGGVFEQDNVVPGDIGRVCGRIVVDGAARDGQKKVYVYGPEILSLRESYFRIGQVLGREVEVTGLGEEASLEKYLTAELPEVFARYMMKVACHAGPDKGNGERFPRWEEGVRNVEIYTGRKAMGFDEWVRENEELFV